MTTEEIIQAKKQQLAQEKILVSEEALREQASELERVPLSLERALTRSGLAVIGPVMKASPLTKKTRGDFDCAETARLEQRLGVDALMVATDQTYFGGQQKFVGQVRKYAQVPVLLYDYIIEQYQIYAAANLGADAVVLMPELLDLDLISRFTTLIHTLGMEAVIEVHTQAQMTVALQSGLTMIMIRNLGFDGSGSLSVTKELLPAIPEGNVGISWGDISSVEDLKDVQSWGAEAACPDRSLFDTVPRRTLRQITGR
ncbi:MAG: hypothetical protein HDQ87_11520 [Clostridia bacterium]|nr:hypothetical protein [Clostridia bacterium]